MSESQPQPTVPADFRGQAGFDALWQFLTDWHGQGATFDPHERKQPPSGDADYEPLVTLVRTARERAVAVNTLLEGEFKDEFPDWFLPRVCELEGVPDERLADLPQEFPPGFLKKASTTGKNFHAYGNEYTLELDGHHILTQIGSGGMGLVLKAYHPSSPPKFENLWAMKLQLPRHEVAESDHRHLREFDKLKELQHTNIIAVDPS